MSRAIQVVWKTSAVSSSGGLAVDDGGVPFVLDLHIPIPRNHGLVVYTYLSGWWYTYPSQKWWSSSVGMMNFPIWWESHNPVMFQTTNQLYIFGIEWESEHIGEDGNRHGMRFGDGLPGSDLCPTIGRWCTSLLWATLCCAFSTAQSA